MYLLADANTTLQLLNNCVLCKIESNAFSYIWILYGCHLTSRKSNELSQDHKSSPKPGRRYSFKYHPILSLEYLFLQLLLCFQVRFIVSNNGRNNTFTRKVAKLKVAYSQPLRSIWLVHIYFNCIAIVTSYHILAVQTNTTIGRSATSRDQSRSAIGFYAEVIQKKTCEQ